MSGGDVQERAALADRIERIAKRAQHAGRGQYRPRLERIADRLRRGLAHPGWRELHAMCTRTEAILDDIDANDARIATLRALGTGVTPAA